MNNGNNGNARGDDRKAILKRIRQALKVEAPQPGTKGSHQGALLPTAENGIAPTRAPGVDPLFAQSPNLLPMVNSGPVARVPMRDWLPRVGGSWEEQAELFASNARELKAEFFRLQDETELAPHLQALREECGWTRVASHRGDLTQQACDALQLPALMTDEAYEIGDLEKCEVGISGCAALVAQTGSVLVTSATSGGRVLSVLPPHHVVVARREQLVPDLAAAFALLTQNGAGYPAFLSFITGPSRTGDIERILVLGAHGPKRLTIFCV